MELIYVNIEGLQSDLAILRWNETMFRKQADSIRAGISHMQNGLDSKSLAKYGKEIRNLESEISRLESFLGWACLLIQESINRYQTLDQTLALHAEDMFDESGSVTAPPTQLSSEYNTYKYGSNYYYTVTSFEEYAEKQKYVNNCTSTAWCMGLGIINREHYDATSPTFWGIGGANWVDQYGRWEYPDKTAISVKETQDIWTKAYDEIASGIPVVLNATNNNEYGGQHSCLIVGVRPEAQSDSIRLEDFLVIDPGDGKTKLLSEVGYTSFDNAWIRRYQIK